MIRLLKLFVLASLLAALAACGGGSDAADEAESNGAAPEDAPAATTEPVSQPDAAPDAPATTPTPAPTPTSQTLNETQQMDEGEFLTNSTSFAIFSGGWGGAGVAGFTQTSTKGSFLVSVTRAGPFKVTDADAGDKDYFRVDVKFDNVTDDKASFAPDSFMLTDAAGNQVEYVADATDLDLEIGVDVNPGATHRGYALFHPVAADTATVNFTFKLGKDAGGAPHDLAFELDLSQVTWPEQ